MRHTDHDVVREDARTPPTRTPRPGDEILAVDRDTDAERAARIERIVEEQLPNANVWPDDTATFKQRTLSAPKVQGR